MSRFYDENANSSVDEVLRLVKINKYGFYRFMLIKVKNQRHKQEILKLNSKCM